MDNKLIKNSRPDGIHFLLEFFGCDEKQLDDERLWKNVLKKGSESSNIPVLADNIYRFEPQGITGFLLLASSHISIHTWPEYNYAACDVFSCSPQKDTENLVDFLIKSIRHKKVEIKKIKRGYKFFDFGKVINENNELVIPVFKTGEEIKTPIKRIIGNIKSDFQEILFIDTEEFGKCLIIDGLTQTSDNDHEIYDRAILKPLGKNDKDILILGGGDGYVAEMALKNNSNLNIKIVDLDVEVIHGCKKYLGQKVFENPRVKLYIEDGFNYLKNTIKKNGKLDGIVCDLTDEPIRKKDQKDFEKFYGEIFSLSEKALKKDGWISLQAGASEVSSGHIDAVAILKRLLAKNFKDVSRKDILIPSFGEENAFLYARKK